jgi:hypothetical protein
MPIEFTTRMNPNIFTNKEHTLVYVGPNGPETLDLVRVRKAKKERYVYFLFKDPKTRQMYNCFCDQGNGQLLVGNGPLHMFRVEDFDMFKKYVDRKD